MFGEPYKKRTLLWLKNLQPLKPTNWIKPEKTWCPSGGHNGKTRKPGIAKKNWKQRAITFQGIADAMAEQWSIEKNTEYEQTKIFI